MQNRFKNIAAVVSMALLASVAMLPTTASAQQTLGDSPGVWQLVSGNDITASGTSGTFTNNGAWLGNAYMVLSATNVAGTTPTLACTLQSSTDGSTWTTLSPVASVTTNYPATGRGTIAVALVGPVQNYAYLRTTNAIGGTASPEYIYSLSLILPAKYK
jgi:hypothetical protein